MSNDALFDMRGNFAISLLGFILLLSIASGSVGFIVGRARARGPTNTAEIYKGDGIPY